MAAKVELAPVTLEDRVLAFKWRNDARIYRWTRQNTPISLEQHEKYWANIPETSKMYSVRACLDNFKTVGICGLTNISRDHRTGEFSLYIGPDHQRKGYGKSALEALLYMGFSRMDLELIEGITFEENPALRMFIDVGMLQDGKLRSRYRKEGKRTDVIVVSITQPEFAEKYSWMKAPSS